MIPKRLKLVREGVAWLRSKECPDLASIWGSLAAEPVKTMRLACWSARPSALLDPSSLSREQQGLNPILFVHGKWGSGGQFGPLIEVLQGSGLAGRPLFSVELPDRGRFSEGDHSKLWGRIEAIYALYPEGQREQLRLDLVGYSRGAEVVSQAVFEEVFIDFGKELRLRSGIGRVVLVGSPLSSRLPNDTRLPESLLEVDGEWDILVKGRSVLLGKQRYNVPRCGHCGLFLSEESLGQIVSWLLRP